ncbi:MAG: MBL fold metallo-hydrolase [Siphonobacter sp.]
MICFFWQILKYPLSHFDRSVLLFLLIDVFTCSAQNNNEKAIRLIKETIHTPSSSCLIKAKGTIYNLGHYNIPEKTVEIPLEDTYGFFPEEQVTYLYSQIQNNGTFFTHEAVSKQDTLCEKKYYESKYKFSGKSVCDEFIFQVSKVWPEHLLRFALKNQKALQWLRKEGKNDLISFSYKGNDVVILYINSRTHQLTKVSQPFYDNVYGNTYHITEYSAYNKDGYPTHRVDWEYGIKERELTYESVQNGIKTDVISLKKLPDNFNQKLSERIDKRETLVWETLTPTLDLIKIQSQNNKVLVAHSGSQLALFETPAGIDLNQQILEEIRTHYPDKTLGYLFVTHHHPDHAGGIYTYNTFPITLVTTPGNQSYFNKLLHASHSWAGYPSPVKSQIQLDFVPLNGKKTFDTFGVTAYEIGKENGHTNEHLVYYFPQEKLLWTGDLLFFRTDGRIYSAGNRGKAVYDLIMKHNLVVDKIFTSWPLYNQKVFGTLEELKKSVEAK